MVALETAVLTHGLPRQPSRAVTCADADWNEHAPLNLEVMRMLARTVRSKGAVPAIVAVGGGGLRVGLDDAELARLAADEEAAKATLSNLAHLMTTGRNAGTTVAATLAACALPGRADRIATFATGGIGGLHPGWAEHLDVSADLGGLARAPVCVVCSGPKSLLDVPATLEALEALGVPVVGFRSDRMARFLTGPGREPVNQRVDDADAVAALCAAHWDELGHSSAVLLANQTPSAHAVDAGVLEAAIEQAETRARTEGITGAARTPFVLAEMARLTGGHALNANVALLAANASLAADVAVAAANRAS